MIIEFSIGNYRSFNKIQTVNFRATGLKSEDESVDANNIAVVDEQRLLKTIGVYGANASGKSNLVKGIHFLKRMVKWSLDNEELLSDIQNPNKQAIINKADNWGYYQIVLLLDGKKYRYGFTLGEEEVATEWLFGPAEKSETFYFTRKGKKININSDRFPEGSNLPYESKLRSNTLFLSFCSSYNGEIAGKIRAFISNKIKHDGFSKNSADRIDPNENTNTLVDENKKEVVLKWLEEAGLFYNDIEIQRKFSQTDTHTFRLLDIPPTVILYKNIYGEKGEIVRDVPTNLLYEESDGTQKYYSFIGKLYDKFENGGLFISDEIDSNFHPLLLRKIISLFNNPIINKANAQLLFTSHETSLMNPQIMRRDQFYFTEKSINDATILYSLSDLKGIRNNADFARQYLIGYYGALPVLGNFLENNVVAGNI